MENPRREFLKRLGVGAAAVALALPSPPARAAAAAETFDAEAHGATGDDKTLDTTAIDKAIDAAHAAGGGTVFFPAGNYLCYSIHLKSNVELHLSQGATIIAADSPAAGVSGYDHAEPNQWDKYQDFGHSHFHNSLIWGESIENVAITNGRIWGK